MIQECIDLKISDTVMTTQEGINSEVEGANTRRVLNIPSKRSLYLMRSSHTSAHLQKKAHASHFELFNTHIYHKC